MKLLQNLVTFQQYHALQTVCVTAYTHSILNHSQTHPVPQHASHLRRVSIMHINLQDQIKELQIFLEVKSKLIAA
jgi:hypothetical protein